MKRVYLIAILICALTVPSFAQTTATPPPPPPAGAVPASTPHIDTPGIKYPEMPAFNSLNLDSVVFNTFSVKKGKPTILILFSPTCEHCQKMTEHLVKAMDSLKHINFYMFAFGAPLKTIAEYRTKFGLDKFKNVWMGKDDQFFLPSFYLCRDVPFIVLYDKNKNLLKPFYNGLKVEEILAELDK